MKNKQEPKILMVVRDAGPANHLAAIAREIRATTNWDFHAYVQGPAVDVFKTAQVEAITIQSHSALPGALKLSALFHEAHGIMLDHAPDLVIAGNSSTADTVGIDEAVTELNIGKPTVFLQDWPGSLSNFAQVKNPLHHYLCISPSAKELTEQAGFKARAHFIGSAAYDSYGQKNFPELRKNFRRDLSARAPNATGKKIVVFSGQYLTEHPGYLDLVESLAREVSRHSNTFLIYRPHPRERVREAEGTHMDVSLTSARIEKHLPGRWTQDWNKSPFESMSGADVLAGYFSTSMHDMAMANAFSDKPLGVPMAMMWDRVTNAAVKVDRYPWFEGNTGIGMIVEHHNTFSRRMEAALRRETKLAVWEAARATGVQNTGPAASNAVKAISQLVA